MLNAAVIGLGVGLKHAQAYENHPNCELVAICDVSSDRLQECSHSFQGVTATTEADSILENPHVDVVSIASYDDDHYHQIAKAVRNGKHVFVEKPICLHAEELKSIRKLLTMNPGIRLSSNLNLRTCPRFIKLKNEIHSGDMGKLFSIEADYLWGRVSKLTDGWRKDMDYYSIILGAAVHMIDLVVWATGRKPILVMGQGNQIATQGTAMKFNDFATLILTFEDGLVAKISANAGCVHPHFHRVAAYGTEKTFVHEHNRGLMYTSRNHKDQPHTIEEEYPGISHKQEMIHSFIDAINNNDAKPQIEEADVFDTMSICFAAEEAVKTNKAVTIQYI